MRVVHLETGRRLYGGARQVAYLIAGLEPLGVDNVLLCPRDSALARCALPAEVIELPLGGDLDVGQLRRITRALRSVRPDLLHVHSRRGADLFGGLAARRAGAAAVLTRRVVSAELVPWARLKFRAYERVVAISAAVRAELTGRFGLDPAKVALVRSAVDTRRYRPREARGELARAFGLPAGATVLGNVAQLIPRKGHATLLEAFAQLAGANPNLHLVCFGAGRLERTLERRVIALGLRARVRLAGYRDDLADLLPGLDLLVHAAGREGLGVALLEALSAGVPVVAARAGGVPEIIEDGVTGLLVPPGDAAALAAAIERVLGDGELRAALEAQGRRKVERMFSIERMARGNLAVYRDITG